MVKKTFFKLYTCVLGAFCHGINNTLPLHYRMLHQFLCGYRIFVKPLIYLLYLSFFDK